MTRAEANMEVLRDIVDKKNFLSPEEKSTMLLADISASLAIIADALSKEKEDKLDE